MKQYHLNKKEILYWANKARRFLNLPKIDIEVEKIEYAGAPENYFNTELINIRLAQCKKYLIIENYGKFKYNLSDKETLIFVIFHEMAHYFQFFKHRPWFEIFRNVYGTKFSSFDHNQQKLEVNANKIAYILYKQIYLNKDLK